MVRAAMMMMAVKAMKETLHCFLPVDLAVQFHVYNNHSAEKISD